LQLNANSHIDNEKNNINSKTTSQQENDGIGIELNGNSTVKVNTIGMDISLCTHRQLIQQIQI
jgi:hypothetical protein